MDASFRAQEYHKEPESFKLYSTPLLLQFNQQVKQPYTLQLNKTTDDVSIYLSGFDLALISQVSPLFISTQGMREVLSELAISGQVSEIYFKKTIFYLNLFMKNTF